MPTDLDLTPFVRALAALDRGLLRWTGSPGDEELRDACIQRFEFTFELAWKMLKRRLERDLPNAAELDGMSYRALIRSGVEAGLLTAPEPWFVYREKRNITSHIYDAAKATEVAEVIPGFFHDARALLAALQQRAAEDAA